MGDKYGVVTEPREEQAAETLRRTGDMAHTDRCPQCDARLLVTSTLTRRCPNCGSEPFEG